MDMRYSAEVITPAWVIAAIILLGVGVFQFVVFVLEGLFDTGPMPLRYTPIVV